MKFDLHIHSHKSYDSVASIKTIIGNAKKRRLKGIAITDHEALTSDDVVEMARANDIWLIKGIEAKTEIGDIIGLFVSKDLKSRKAAYLLDEIHDQGGVAILAHPFKYMKKLDDYPTKIIEKVDAIEIVNARWEDLRSFPKSKLVDKLLSAVQGRSAGSDSHFPFEVGRAYWTASDITSPDDLKKSICANTGEAVVASFSQWLDGPSQFIKFLKKPTLKQLARMAYWSCSRVVFGRTTIPNESE
jgi:predicted metal-dependent phosphoesterase TrpH